MNPLLLYKRWGVDASSPAGGFSILTDLSPDYDFDANRDTLYADSGSTEASDDGAVQQFTDAAGGITATQTESGTTFQGVRKASQRNGRDVIRLDGSDDRYLLGDDVLDPGTNDLTMIAVVGLVNNTSGRLWQKRGAGAFGSQAGWIFGLRLQTEANDPNNYALNPVGGDTAIDSGAGATVLDSGSFENLSSDLDETWAIYMIEWDNGSNLLVPYLNNTDASTDFPQSGDASGGDVSNSRECVIGCRYDTTGSPNTAQFWGGDIGRLIWFPRLLTSQEKTDAHNELAADWGITL